MDANRNMHRADIKATLEKLGFTLQSVALAHGVTPGAVSKSLVMPVPAANLAIAETLETTVHALWPEWFAPDGSLFPLSERKNSARRRSSHRQNGAAA